MDVIELLILCKFTVNTVSINCTPKIVMFTHVRLKMHICQSFVSVCGCV